MILLVFNEIIMLLLIKQSQDKRTRSHTEWRLSDVWGKARVTHRMIFHQTYPHSRPPDHSSNCEVYIVRSGRRTALPDRAGLRKKKEAT